MSSCDVLSSQMEHFSKDNSVTSKLADDLDAKVTTSSKQVLLQRIEFKAASKPDEQYEKLKRKYQPLNSSTSYVNEGFVKNSHDNSSSKHEDLPEPKTVLCHADKVKTQWDRMRRVGPGLSNLGNTCYLNSVLQVLTYTAPLVNFLSTQEHSKECRAVGFCMMCELQRHVIRTFSHHQNESIKPLAIIQKLRNIAKHLRFGHQEDAHEFLRYVIDGLQKSSLNGLPEKLDRWTKETTFIHRIFGGYYRSQVRCLMCHNTSNTFDPLMEIMLDIKHASSVIRALQCSCKPDRLDGDNLYYCLKCKKKVPAHKQVLIHRHPNILTLQLKRFDSNHIFGGKVAKQVEYTEYLDLRPFMTNTKGPPLRYRLYAVLVHSGYSSNSGHYYSYIRASNNSWYNMNDSVVRQVGLNAVLSQQAYLLFYSKMPDNSSQPEKKPFSPIATKPSGYQTGASVPKIIKDNDIGTPVSRNGIQSKGLSTPTSTVTKVTPTTPNSPSVIPIGQRPKLSFSLKTPTKVSTPLGKAKEVQKRLDDKTKDEMQKKQGEKSAVDKDTATQHEGPKKSEVPSSSVGSSISNKQEKIEETSESLKQKNLKPADPVPVSFPIKKDEKIHSPTKKTRPSPLFIPRSVHSKDILNQSKSTPSKDAGDSSMTSPAKATTPWKITPMPPQFHSNHIYGPMSPPPKGTPIPQPSPSSVKSDGSSSSSVVGKTGEWAVMDKNLPTPGPRLPERQHAGWTVMEKSGTEASMDNSEGKGDEVKDEEDWVECTPEKSKKSRKKRKKEKKMKKKYEKFESVFESGGDDDNENKDHTEKRKKKDKHKKKKKNKEKTEDKKELLGEDSSSSEKKKKKRHKKEENDKETENKRQKLVDYSSNDSSDSYNEQDTKECNQNEKDLHKKEKKEVPVVIYDGERQDKPRRTTWDGSRDTSTVNQLLKSSKGLVGYGANVSSWEGGQSHVDSYDNDEDSTGNRKRRHDSWDEELDRGKVKKVKDKFKYERFSSGQNLFQREQDKRNKKPVSEKITSHFARRHSFHSRTHSGRNYRRM